MNPSDVAVSDVTISDVPIKPLDVLVGPVVGLVTDTTVRVLLETSEAGDVVIHFSPAAGGPTVVVEKTFK